MRAILVLIVTGIVIILTRGTPAPSRYQGTTYQQEVQNYNAMCLGAAISRCELIR